MSRQTPTSRRSPSILVTDARKTQNHKAPFVRRKLNVSVDSLISQTSEVPSAQTRAPPPSAFRKRKPRPSLSELARQHSQSPPLGSGSGPGSGSGSGGATGSGSGSGSGYGTATGNSTSTSTYFTPNERSHLLPKLRNPLNTQPQPPLTHAPSHIPLLSKPLSTRSSKQVQRHVLIPEQSEQEDNISLNFPKDQQMRVSSYLIAESIDLPHAAHFLKRRHKARVRLYDEALFGDYLLPLLPGDDVDFRIRSSVGDNRTMEKMIDLSEQHDHHYEYFSTNDSDPSEPMAFTPPKHDRQFDSDGKQPIDETHDLAQLSEFSAKERYKSHAELFLFDYGVIVFWNFTEVQEKQVLADLCLGSENLLLNVYSDQEIECEEMMFAYTESSENPRVYNDLILLNSGSHMLKLAMSHALAQSTVLIGFEQRMQTHFTNVADIPKTLALTGKLGLNREQLLKISGQLFKLRVDVNLSSNVLDIPEFFWDSEPSLFPLFSALREYLEIDQRVEVLNERQSVFLELTGVLGDSIAEFNMDRITIIVIWLIVLSIVVSLSEIMVRYIILRKSGAGNLP